jgi:putative ABC transport system permease protein
LAEEFAFHLELEVEKNIREGLSPEEARRRALLTFGGVERHKDAVRDARGLRWLDEMAADLRYAGRMLRKRPASTAVIVATLALGIGTSVMIYSAGRSLVFGAIPFPDPDRLVTVELHGEQGRWLSPSRDDFQALESAVAGSIALGAYTFDHLFVGDGTRTYQLRGSRVTGDFFSALAIEPLLGRILTPADEAPGNELVAVITARLWENQFGADPAIIGRPVQIDGRFHTIVGVIPTGLQYPAGVELWTPLGPPVADAASPYLVVLGRLRTGATREEVRTVLATVQHGLDQGRPATVHVTRVAVQPLSGQPSGDDMIAFLLLQGAVLALLLIASTNAAGLMLMRALERRQEIAVRASLGAGHGRITRQFLVESMLLTGTSAALGLGVAHLGIAGLRRAVPPSFSSNMLGWDRFGVDGHAVLAALVLAVLTGALIGILPARRVLRGDLTAELREGAPTATAGRRGSRVVRLLLSGEVALALVLLLTAGLLTRSLLALLDADPGFDSDGVLTIQWTLPPERYAGQDAVVRFQDPVQERLAAIPAIRSAGLVSNLPMTRTGWTRRYRIEGDDVDADSRNANWRPVTLGYFSTLGIALMSGRPFLDTDIAGAPGVAIIGEALARREWPDGASPLGKRLRLGDEEWTVFGVARDVHDYGAGRRAGPTIYIPQAQAPTTAGFLALRVAGDPADFAHQLRQAIWDLDPEIALGEIATLPRVVRDFYADSRLLAQLLTAFGLISLLITIVSLYTLVAHSVARRRREIGIRLALGAHPRQILAGAMAQGVVWVGVGVIVGLALAAGVARVLKALLYGVGPLDPAVFVLVPAGLLAIALLASYLPAASAAAVEPTEALR